MTEVLFDGEPIDLRVNPDKFFSGGVLAGQNGGLLSWAVLVAPHNRFMLYDQSLTRSIDTIDHVAGGAEALRLGIGNSPTYRIDMDRLENGNVVVSWVESVGRPPDFHGYFRIYDDKGRAVTLKTEFLNSDGLATSIADVDVLETGGFCATWGEYRQGSSDSFAQIFAADGTAIGAAFRLNGSTEGDQQVVGSTGLDGGGFMALWVDRQASGSETLVARAFSDTGAALGRSFKITDVEGDDYLQIIRSQTLENGDVVVAWKRVDPLGNLPDRIEMQSFHPNGDAVSAEVTVAVADGLESDHFGLGALALLALGDGRWIVAWTSQNYDAASFEHQGRAFARIYNADGSLSQEVFDLVPGRRDIEALSMDELADGRVALHLTFGLIPADPSAAVQIIDPRQSAVHLTGTDRADRLQGTVWDDRLEGGARADKLAGSAGADVILGGAHLDSLSGGDGNDRLLGGSEADVLLGEAGNDTLAGGKGDDHLRGGQGRDWFIFTPGDGQDVVADFRVDQDVLDLRKFHLADAAAALALMSEVEGGTLFQSGADSIFLEAVGLADLTVGALLV